MEVVTDRKPLEPGIHLGLPEDRHHADSALGSTNLRNLYKTATDYWWDSNMNPLRLEEDEETAAKKRGTAIHKFVLEGSQSFYAAYMRRPDDIKGASSSEKGTLTKAWNKEAALKGKELLHGRDYDRIVVSSKIIMLNPELTEAFTGGIPEVTVIWERTPVIRLKARLDYLKPRAITDLKSITNMLKLDFEWACKRSIRTYDYDMQAALYMEGRSKIRKYVEEGKVFASNTTMLKDYGDLLEKIAQSDEFAFVFVFFSAAGAPLTWGATISPKNPGLIEARQKVNIAIDRYIECREKFGNGFWVTYKPLRELAFEELPQW